MSHRTQSVSMNKQTFASTHEHAGAAAYLDCNATTPIEPAVLEAMQRAWADSPSNAGSRTHEYGTRAKKAVQTARTQIAEPIGAQADEVIFTSGATESNNIALLGLSAFGERSGRRHIVSTAIEHKAVLEPLEQLEKRGFEITLIAPDGSGAIKPEQVHEAMRGDTLAVSVMYVNNETGVGQPLEEIAGLLEGHEAYFHVDAAQGYGKDNAALANPRIDLVSISSHKVFGPVGVGALIARRRGFKRPPLEPLMFGGGQERGLRPGTLPVPLIIGFGLAAELAAAEAAGRREKCRSIRREAVAALEPLGIVLNGDESLMMPHVLNFSIDGIDSEAVMVALKGLAAISNGSACTSLSYEPSHVLKAMGLSETRTAGAVRVSWCHLTGQVDWPGIAERLRLLRD